MIDELTLETKVKLAWLQHCQGREHFPREIMVREEVESKKFRKRRKVEDFDSLYNSCKAYYGKKNLFTSVYSDQQRANFTLNRVYLDLDYDKVGLAEKRIETCYEDLEKIRKKFPVTAYLTGSKGFAVYIAFLPLKLRNPNIAIRTVVFDLEETLQLKTLDHSVIGDISRVSRLPYTLNLKSNKYCIPVSPAWSLDYILEQAENPTEFLPISFTFSGKFRGELEDVDKDLPEWIPPKSYSKPDSSKLREEAIGIVDIAQKITDGRQRILFYLLIPRLVLSEEDNTVVAYVCKQFIESSGRPWREYEDYAERVIRQTREKVEKGETLLFSFESFFQRFPELMHFFKRDENVKALDISDIS